jgi:isopenicillin-N epimerase
MIPQRAAEFGFDPALVQLNHASFGAPTLAALDRLDAQHRRIERDTAARLLDGLAEDLAPVRRLVAGLLGADEGQVALVANATEASGALATSLPLEAGEAVALLDVEYESVLRAWQERCARSGARLVVLRTPVPATADSLVAAFDRLPAGTRYVVVSAVTSSTALRVPVREVVRLAAAQGAAVLLDAAHVVGHEPLDVAGSGALAAFGSLHKWLPAPRSSGFLWLAPSVVGVVRPAAVALHYDEDLGARFAWRGTWDPAPALGLPEAVHEWRGWEESGDLRRAAALADVATEELAAAGWQPTGSAPLLPARLRAFVVPAPLDRLRTAAHAAGVRLWPGTAPDGRTLARLATHVWTDESDVARAAAVARSLGAASR